MLKRQRFGDNGSDKMEPRESKCQHLNEHDNEERNDLDEDESEKKGAR